MKRGQLLEFITRLTRSWCYCIGLLENGLNHFAIRAMKLQWLRRIVYVVVNYHIFEPGIEWICLVRRSYLPIVLLRLCSCYILSFAFLLFVLETVIFSVCYTFCCWKRLKYHNSWQVRIINFSIFEMIIKMRAILYFPNTKFKQSIVIVIKIDFQIFVFFFSHLEVLSHF